MESNNLGTALKNTIGKIRIFDYNARPFQILIDGVTKHTSYTYNAATRELDITNLQIPFNKYFYLRFNLKKCVLINNKILETVSRQFRGSFNFHQIHHQ